MRYLLLFALVFSLQGFRRSAAGEPVPSAFTPGEMQALDRAISREVNSGNMNSETLADLTRLKNKLEMIRPPSSPSQAAGAPAGDPAEGLLLHMERTAADGGRQARRALAFLHLALNDPERALEQWRRAGRASGQDMAYPLVLGYLQMSLGQANDGKPELERALSIMQSRLPLSLSGLVFCTTIAGYRTYVPRPEGAVLPGEDVLVYVEIEGAEFRETPDRGSECLLRFSLKIQDDGQRTVWADPEFGEYSPVFSGPIRDLHAALTLRIPNDLEPGRHHLYVSALDAETNRLGEAVMGFDVKKRPTNPETRPTAAGTSAAPPAPLPGFPSLAPAPGTASPMPNVPLDGRALDILRQHYDQQKPQ